jgi:hypothetical protein
VVTLTMPQPGDNGIMDGLTAFRKYDEADLDVVLAICAAEGWSTYTENRTRARQVFTAPGVVSSVATVDDEVAGFAYCQTDGLFRPIYLFMSWRRAIVGPD